MAEKTITELATDKTTKHVKNHWSDYAVGGAGVVLLKGVSDLNKVDRNLDIWRSKVESVAKGTDGPLNWKETQDILDRYGDYGNRIARTRVLGVPSGKYLQGYKSTKELGFKIKGDRAGAEDAKSGVEHYRIFSKKDNKTEIMNHLIEKGINDVSVTEHYNGKGGTPLLKDPQFLQPRVKEIIFDHRNTPLEARYTALINEGYVDQAEKFKSAIMGGNGNMGEARRLGGATHIVSTPDIYGSHILNNSRAIKSVAGPVGAGLLLGGIAGIALKHMDKTGSYKKREDRVKGTFMLGGGAGAVGIGANKLLDNSKSIAFSYGTMPWIGEGHKSPGVSIRKILESDDRFSGVTMENLERDRHGNTPTVAKKYDIAINTGLGFDLPDGQMWADQSNKTHGNNRKVSTLPASRKIRVQTDGTSEGGRLHSFSSINPTNTGSDKVLMFGEESKKVPAKEFKGKRVHMPSNFQPAIDPQIVESIYNGKKESNLDFLQSHLKDKMTLVMDPAVKLDMEETIAKIDSVRGKKFITVTGAGRGDFVGSRAHLLSKKLKELGMDKEYTVVAARAGSKGDALEHLLKSDPNVISLGFLDRGAYTKLQASGEVHWGTTGASSVSEAALMKNIQGIPRNWGWNDGLTPGTIADREQKIRGNTHGFPNLDDYNRGNIQEGLKSGKFVEMNNEDDVIKYLKDDKLRQSALESSSRLADSHYANVKNSQKLISDEVYKSLEGVINRRKLTGAAVAAGGIGLAAIGAHKLLKD